MSMQPISTTSKLLMITIDIDWVIDMGLIMGCLAMPLDKLAREITTVIAEWRLYKYQVLFNGVMLVLDIFQH